MPYSGPGTGRDPYRSKLTGKNWTLDWNGKRLVIGGIWAALAAIDELNESAVEIARQHPFWDNDTGQTEAALFVRAATIERGTTARSNPHVWGMWGVADLPHYKGPDQDREVMLNASAKYQAQYDETYGEGEVDAPSKLLTTVDVALFLEFGTVDMQPRPWLYPAWDFTKQALPELYAGRFRDFMKTGRVRAPGGSPGGIGGQFISFAQVAAQGLVSRIR